MSKRIVVISRDRALVQLVQEQFESRGISIEAAPDGRDGVARMRGNPPDLVLVEVELSEGQNGYLICGMLKKDEATRYVPVVLVGDPEGFAMHQKLKGRADCYVAKPVDPAVLTAEVARLLENAPAAAAAPTARAAPSSAPRAGLWARLRQLWSS